ncbi:MAG: hypothetical protein BroJett030_08370 [Alphaproteobacteria bacterium]|nr:MAG: hypothetical protein BroJett030_08370 [Alphaproteobacteria bacterium]
MVRIAVACLIWLLTPAFAPAAEQFVVIHVEPAVPDLVPGAVYRSEPGAPEFVFVPAGVKAVLLGESGASYVIEGRAAVEARGEALETFRLRRGQEDNAGLLQLVLGVAGLEDITAASRKLPSSGRPAGSDEDAAARLPLIIELLARMGRGEPFCLIADALVVRRLDARFLDRVRIEFGGRVIEENWLPNRIAVRFAGLGIAEGARAELKVATKVEERAITVLRLPAGTLGGEAFANAAALAKRGCTVQAMMVAEQLAGQ